MIECPRCEFEFEIGWDPGSCPGCGLRYEVDQMGSTWSGDEYPIAVWEVIEKMGDNLDSNRDHVLVFTGYPDKMFFESQNLYLGIANLASDLEKATLMPLIEAEKAIECMDEKDKWEIWSVRSGLVLDSKSERHIIRAKRKMLEDELNSLPKVDQ